MFLGVRDELRVNNIPFDAHAEDAQRVCAGLSRRDQQNVILAPWNIKPSASGGVCRAKLPERQHQDIRLVSVLLLSSIRAVSVLMSIRISISIRLFD